MKNFKIFKSSAGSGKTFTLVKEYLKLALSHPDDFRSILAITFTNKAAEEMKTRIVETLVSLSSGEESAMFHLLSAEPSLEKLPIRKNAARCLKNILHDYSSFAVSTIDSFFHRILRSLAREIHLPLNLDVKIDSEDAILEVTDSLLKEVGVDAELTQWLTNLALQKMDEDKGWSIEGDIKIVAKELLKDKSKDDKTLTREEIHELYKKLLLIREDFEKHMQKIGSEAIRIFEKHNLSLEDFSYGKSGVANYFFRITEKFCKDYRLGARALSALQDAEKWIGKKHPRRNELIGLVEDKLLPLLSNAHDHCEKGHRDYTTANEILKKIYLFGIVNDLQKKFSEYRKENNTILIADTTRLLGQIIEGNDTPFIYEKAGNRFKHLLIDEFQDTSLSQWTNLLPLIVNSLGSGFTTLVVGDAKQSIYRWRGGNMNLLIRDIFTDLQHYKEMFDPNVLGTNFRSKKEIVEFNNKFFATATTVLNEQVEMDEAETINLAYDADLIQAFAPKNNSGGYVRIEFLSDDEEQNSDEDESEERGWKETAKIKLLDQLFELQKLNYTWRDIAILVRNNREGNEIATFLLENGIDKIISPDSLLISASPRIGFLINTFRFLADTRNMIAKSEIIYYYATQLQPEERDNHELFIDHKTGWRKKQNGTATLFETDSLKKDLFNRILPPAFTGEIKSLSRLPVYELSERLIGIFKLNEQPDAYLQRFQDLVLEYSSMNDSSLDGFVRWWESSPKVSDCSVIIPSNENAIRIMTIHKSKGLQFPVVFMPFADWKITPKSNEIMWMKATEKPFSDFGKVAVLSSKSLLDSHFEAAFRNELKDTVIDNLNLLYVAFTRAEHKLIAYCCTDNGKDLNTTSKLLFRTLNRMYDGIESVAEIGTNDPKPVGKLNEDKNESETLKVYPSNPWNQKLRLKTHSSDLMDAVSESTKRMNYGKLMHQLLSEIKSSDDLPVATEKMVFNGVISHHEAEELHKTVSDVLAEKTIADFFTGTSEVISEKDLILPGGEVLRPDRVLVKDDKLIVIDFKTGKRETAHEKQIRNYAEVLRKMDQRPVESFLIYLNEKAVVAVN